MAIDLRQIGNRNEYADRCWYYASDAVDGNKLVKDAKPLGVFYKKDIVPFKYVRVSINGILTNDSQFQGVVETVDDVNDIRPNMYVVDEYGFLYRVSDEVTHIYKHGNKRYSRRPSSITQITLIGEED